MFSNAVGASQNASENCSAYKTTKGVSKPQAFGRINPSNSFSTEQRAFEMIDLTKQDEQGLLPVKVTRDQGQAQTHQNQPYTQQDQLRVPASSPKQPPAISTTKLPEGPLDPQNSLHQAPGTIPQQSVPFSSPPTIPFNHPAPHQNMDAGDTGNASQSSYVADGSPRAAPLNHYMDRVEPYAVQGYGAPRSTFVLDGGARAMGLNSLMGRAEPCPVHGNDAPGLTQSGEFSDTIN